MKGLRWNESNEYKDPITLRNVRQITTRGIVNTVPSYHTGQAFTHNGEFVIFISVRDGKSLMCKAHLPTGDITCLIDPVDGMGGLEELRQFGNGKGIPIGAVLAPKSGWVYYLVERQIRAVHIDSFEEKIVVDNLEEPHYIESMAVSADEKYLMYIVNILDSEKHGGQRYQIYQKPMDGGPRLLFAEKGLKAGHLQQNPMDPNLLLYCRDKGPSPNHRVDEKSRSWIYNIKESSLTEVKTVEKQNFQTHCAWAWDGKGIVYHGMIKVVSWKNSRSECGWYIGISGLDGNPIREYSFRDAVYYGHVSAMKGKNAAIIDGNIINGLLMSISFDEKIPKVEIIGKHNTDFATMSGQYSHPHAISDPSERWIVYNSSPSTIFYGPRSDIYSIDR